MIHAFTKRYLVCLPVLLLLVLLLLRPALASEAVGNGVRLCLYSILPTLFPFLVLTRMLVGLGFPSLLGKWIGKPFRLLFGISEEGACAFLTGILAGLPTGAAMAVRLYDDGLLREDETVRLLALSAVPGPAFLIGGVGAGMLGDAGKGARLYLLLLLSVTVTGVFLRVFSPPAARKAAPRVPPPAPPFLPLLSESIAGSVSALLPVCGSIVFFSVLSSVLCGISAGHAQLALVIGGILEMTSGCARAAAALPGVLAMPVLAAILSWSGCSVHAQIASLVGERFGLGRYFAAKAVQCAVCVLIAVLIL